MREKTENRGEGVNRREKKDRRRRYEQKEKKKTEGEGMNRRGKKDGRYGREKERRKTAFRSIFNKQ